MSARYTSTGLGTKPHLFAIRFVGFVFLRKRTKPKVQNALFPKLGPVPNRVLRLKFDFGTLDDPEVVHCGWTKPLTGCPGRTTPSKTQGLDAQVPIVWGIIQGIRGGPFSGGGCGGSWGVPLEGSLGGSWGSWGVPFLGFWGNPYFPWGVPFQNWGFP